jgi:hypothetical protein
MGQSKFGLENSTVGKNARRCTPPLVQGAARKLRLVSSGELRDSGQQGTEQLLLGPYYLVQLLIMLISGACELSSLAAWVFVTPMSHKMRAN